MNIRRAKLADCKVCWKMSNTPELLPAGRKKPQLWWIQSFLGRGKTFLVAEDAGKVVGFIFGEGISGRVSLLHSVFVDKKYRRNGVGKSLIENFEKDRKKKGDTVVLTYTQKNAAKFIEKEGYSNGSVLVECEKRISKVNS